jgi:RNA polymerase sigma-70 factor (ECF subfamily)
VEAKDAERARDERDPTGPRPAAPAASAASASGSSSVSAAPPADPERAWLDGLRRGDAASFDAVFAAYRRRLYGYLVRMTRRRDVAEDLLQETFLRLAQHAKRLADDTRLGAWLFTVAHRLFVSWTRAQGVRAVLAAEVPPREPAGGDRSPLDAIAASQAQAALERAFAELAPAYREVALLVGVEGLQPAEVAQILGQKPDAVRQRLARARAQLAAALGEHAPAAWRQP